MNHRMKDLAHSERPYEKSIRDGVASLTDAELLAVILRCGTKDESSVDLANKILNAHEIHKGLLGLNFLNREKLLLIKGIGNTKATQLLAISELSSRMNRYRLKENICFHDPDSIAMYYMEKCKFLTKERTYLMLFSTAHALIREVPISEGTINSALLSPREIFIEALKYEAVHIILVHNHPSGIPEPSFADIQMTRKIMDAGKLLDIRLSDHIIVGNGTYVSLLERGIIR